MIPEELEDKLDYLANTKELLRQKLNEKGVTVSSSDTFRSYATKILELPTLAVESIEAVYTQSGTVYDTDSLDSLESDLVVIAIYNSGATEVVTDYTLSGTLTAGTSTITVSYDTFTDTFDVTVTAGITYLYKWDLTQSLTDSVNGEVALLQGNATFTQGTGVVINGASSGLLMLSATRKLYGLTLEVDFATCQKQTASDVIGCLIMTNWNTTSGFVYSYTNGGWNMKRSSTYLTPTVQSDNANIFDGKKLKMIINSVDDVKVYSGDTLVYEGGFWNSSSTYKANICLGFTSNAFYNMTITGVRIYANQ